MSVRVCCPDCQATYDLPDGFGGKRVRCPKCRAEFDAPAAVDVLEEAEAEIQSQPTRAPSRPGRRDDEPRRRRDDEDNEGRPRRRGPGAVSRQSASPPTGLIVAAVAGGVMLLGCACAGLVFLFLPRAGQPQPAPAVAQKAAVDKQQADEAADIARDPRPPQWPAPEGPPPAAGRDDGRALAPGPIPPPRRVDIRPPALDGDRAELALPAPAADVAVGGDGRFLVLYLPARQQFAVFDANKAAIVKSIPAADNVKFAAGMDKLVVLHPDGTVERWSLLTFEREATGTLRMEVPPVAVAMGSASNGPLLVSGVDWPRLGETAFFDVLAMKRLEMSFDPHGFFNTSPTVFLRASADGRTFACVPNGFDGNTLTCTWSAGRVRKYAGQGGTFPVPGPDGRTLYTGNGPYTVDLRLLAANGTPCLPAHHGPYYLTLPRADGGPGGLDRGTVSVHLEGDGRPFASLAGVDLPAGLPGAEPDKLLRDRRVHLIPDARLLVTIPPGNDRLVLRRFDAEQALEASGLDYVVVTSRAPTAAARGKDYVYQLAAKAKKGGLSYRVLSGPREAAIDAAGKLTWHVPADYPEHEAEIVIAVRDAGGREARHGFWLDVGD
jgi:hypothetical protein